ncbi:MAG: hypothetical protein R3B90_01130 [Planctomycetaceae bacterium]
MTLRPEIQATLESLRGRIRRYVVIEGIALVVALLGALFWFSFAADWAWFRMSRLELPLWFRWGFTLLAAICCIGGLLVWVVFRLMRSYRSRSLALVLERRFPELNDRLVTAVEYADGTRPAPDGLGGVMLEQTVSDAVRTVGSLDLGSVFDSRPLRRAVLMATVLVASVLLLGITNANAMRRWFDAYIAGSSNYWDPYRQSALTVQVIAQPGDRVREFDPNQNYKHPRGADLTLLVSVPDGKAVPDAVTLRYQAFGSEGTSRGAVTMSRVGDRQFRHTIARVIDPHELSVVGGDFTNRVPYRVQIVDPPKIDRLELDCDFPAYTRMIDEPRTVQGARVALPMETSFGFRGIANKPLKSVEIRCDRFVIAAMRTDEPAAPAASTATSDRGGDASAAGVTPPPKSPVVATGTLTLIDPETSESREWPLAPADAARLFTDDPMTVSLPLQIGQQSDARLRELSQQLAKTGQLAELPSPFPLPSDTLLQVYLEDRDEILSFEPAAVTINGVPDLPPVIDVRLTGIGNRVTRLATIPVEGTIVDDYGIADAWFAMRRREGAAADDQPPAAEGDAQPGQAAQSAEVPLAQPPAGKTTLKLERSEQEAVERFDLLPLQLELGTTFELSLNARDNDNLNGPHEAIGPVFTFEVVSEDVLLGSLYDKEMNLRQRFEHIREEIEIVRTDLLIHRGRYTEGEELRAAPESATEPQARQEELRQIAIAMEACANRSLHLLRKNHAETRDVEFRFRDIRAELVNNRADTEAALTRLDAGIIGPLAAINDTGFPGIDEQLGLLVLVIERGQDPRELIDTTVTQFERLMAQMDQILEQMRQRKGFNEVIQELQTIIERQKRVLQETEAERKRSVIDDLFN